MSGTDLHAVALAVAPNGGRRTKADHPALPLTAQEIAREAAACRAAGAAMIHVHVRDRSGRHLLDAEAYRDVIRRIRGEVGDGLVVQATTESLDHYMPAEQRAVAREAAAEAVSLALRELVPDVSEEAPFAGLLADLERAGVWPQIILYSPDEALRLEALRRRGLIPLSRVSVLYAIGRYVDGQCATPTDLLGYLAPGMPRFDHWMACAFGAREAECVIAAALLGGHARIGFENNLRLPGGERAPSNAALVGAVASPLAALGVPILTADTLRRGVGVP